MFVDEFVRNHVLKTLLCIENLNLNICTCENVDRLLDICLDFVFLKIEIRIFQF